MHSPLLPRGLKRVPMLLRGLLCALLPATEESSCATVDPISIGLSRHPGFNATLLLFEALEAVEAPSRHLLGALLAAGALVGARKAECVIERP